MVDRRDLTDLFAGVYAETVLPRAFYGSLFGEPA
jgi:hypothetical protein